MNSLKNLRTHLEKSIVRAWGNLTEGWRELLSRSSGALTHFNTSLHKQEGSQANLDFPHWGLLAAETWETAHSVIIRVEIPGMKKEDFNISIDGNILHIFGEKRSDEERTVRKYRLMERAFGHFERSIPVPHAIDEKNAEVTYQEGVMTLILPKTNPVPPTRLDIS